METVALRERDIGTLREVFRRFPWIREVRIFGSRANGTAGRASDIDLAISAPGATATQWSELAEALEEAPIIFALDLVRLDDLENDRLRDKITREGVTI